MYIKNNSKNNLKDKKYIVKIKLSNNRIQQFYNDNNNNFYNNKNSKVEYIPNNNIKIISDNSRYRHFSYKNFTIPNKLNNMQNIIKNKYYKYNYNSSNNDIQTERIYDIKSRNMLNDNKENDYNINNKIIDQQILDYLNKHNNEKETLIKKMKSQKNIFYNPATNNGNNRNKIINLNNLNNYSYINNNYNYYCTNNQNSSFDHPNVFKKYTKNNNTNNNSINYGINNQVKYPIKKSIYNNYLKKKVKRIVNKKIPLRINYTNENINLQNIMNSKSIMNKNDDNKKILRSSHTSKNLIKIDYFNQNYYKNFNGILSPREYKIPLPAKKISPPKKINKVTSHTVDKINNKITKNDIILEQNSEKTVPINYTLKGCQSLKKMNKTRMYKNKINKKFDRNIIQKSLNLFFSNEKNKIDENIISPCTKININQNRKSHELNEEKIKIPQIHEGIVHKRNNSFNSSINNLNKLINNSNSNIKEITNNNYKRKNDNNTNQNKNKIINKKNYNNINNIIKNNNDSININNNKYNKNNTINNNTKKILVTNKEINEQFNKSKIGKRDILNSEKESECLSFSVQSMNDSKIMELANKYIEDEELNREEIIDILNSKKENNKDL